MKEIVHRMVSANAITMHIAEKGPKQGPVIFFLHGFPEIWYTWRHKIRGLSSLGYRTVAPDFRGYSDSEAPSSVAEYSCFHIVGDLVALLDSLKEEKVFLVGHDWGAIMGWYLCLFRTERVRAFVCLSMPYRPRNPKIKPVEGMRALFGNDYYICRFQEPGKIEQQITRSGRKQVLNKILRDRKPGPPCLAKQNAFGINPDSDIKFPSWFSEEDLSYYVTKFEQSGLTGGLNYYRAMDLNWELTAAWTGAQVGVPVKFIVGDLDSVYTTPGVKEYIHNGGFKRDVPCLEEIIVMEGVGHFIDQEKPEEINNHIYDFITQF